MYKSVSELIENYEQHTSNDRNLCKQGYIDEKTYREHCDLYYSEFCKELEKLEQQSIIKQLLSHIVSLSDKTNWNGESSLWIDCVSLVPDRVFIPYLINILKIQKENVLYFSVLTVIKYLPEEIGEEAVPGICEAISANNPFWTEYVFAEAFEALIFNRNEMAGEFIRKSCLSDVPFIKEWALYYRDNWLEELERNN